ncbi:hypothetical protein EJ04DRAFT_552485 [Polyplosphaeria fusca]|uniref:MARVEL domain-containing protein n=1 Tax=Polyplosphaeria fusca TaxID=682080 RepID=A0A9P4V2X8_9PLEO|nr:hypothetical protein EJ04DRAFT_552485 [Polyplosphaeria fusca]
MASRAIPSSITKVLLCFCHFMTWASAAIVVGITGYFLNNYTHDRSLIYEIVIGASTLAFWLPTFILPLLSSYKSWFLPLNFVYSYLWLTAFIFSAQDYNEGSCYANAPSVGHCSLKLALEAFLFLGFIFTVFATVIDGLVWKSRVAATVAPTPVEKDVAPSAETAP